MISFTISLLALVVGYMIYGRFVERVFGPDDRLTPAVRMADGVDYVVLPGWKIFMIQFLKIAGTGPIFGAILGALYGPSSYLWIVFGCIFAGSVHDYFSGMLSSRNDGAGMPGLVGKYLGSTMKNIMLVFSVFLLIMVGVVFVYSPAVLLERMGGTASMWVMIIFAYYILATMLPIDKIIGRFYPIFAFSLLFMAGALMVMLFINMPALPEVWDGLGNMGKEHFGMKQTIFPCLFITIACGAISGFHGTQSPLMARCMKNEHQGRAIFYGAMITEGIVALIWAAVSSYFFYDEGWRQVCPPEVVEQFTGQSAKTLNQFFSAPKVVTYVCEGWLGLFGGILAILGVVAAPITSGDTAFRSARLIIAEAFGMQQRDVKKRLAVSIPLFIVAMLILFWQIDNPDGFNVIWQYFGWANQTLAVFMLWTITAYLVKAKKTYIVAFVPALFMTMVCSTFFFISDQALELNQTLSYILGGVFTAFTGIWFIMKHKDLMFNK